MAFSTNYSEVNDLLPEGVYEALILTSVEEMTQSGKQRINQKLIIRNDVQQDSQNRVIYNSIYKAKEPNAADQSVGGYIFNSLMRLAKAAGLPEGKSYESLAEFISDFSGRPLKIEVKHEEYNSKKLAKLGRVYVSDFPECKHRPKDDAPVAAAQNIPLPGDEDVPWLR